MSRRIPVKCALFQTSLHDFTQENSHKCPSCARFERAYAHPKLLNSSNLREEATTLARKTGLPKHLHPVSMGESLNLFEELPGFLSNFMQEHCLHLSQSHSYGEQKPMQSIFVSKD